MSPVDRALDPSVAMRAVFLVDGRPLCRLDPPVGLFLAPELVDLIEDLEPLVRETIATLTASAAVRGEALPRDRAAALLSGIVERWVTARPGAERWVEAARDGAGRLRLSPRTEGLDRMIAPDRVVIRIELTRGTARADVDIPLASAGPLAVVMDGLRGDYPSGLDLALADRGARAVVAALESIGGLVAAEAAGPIFVPEGHDAKGLTATHMGHAFLIVDGGSRRLLFDPVVHAWREEFVVQPLTARQLGPVDAIFFTHHHAGHMDAASLLMLPHRVPVYVPAATDQPLVPRCADYLRMLGFTDVREVAAGDVVSVGDVRVQALPFTGRGREVLGFGANVYVASLGLDRVLVHSDASPDTAGRSIVATGEAARLATTGGAIRTVYATWWQERAFLCALSPLALLAPDVSSDRWFETVAVRDCPMEFLVALVKACRARRLVTYAEGQHEAFLPERLRSGAADTAALLWRPRDEVCRSVMHRTGVETLEGRPFLQVRVGR